MEVNMAPQLIYLALMVLGLGVSLAKHGEPRSPMNAGTHILGLAIAISLLWWGGFFDPLLVR
jgi:hypothetical protein